MKRIATLALALASALALALPAGLGAQVTPDPNAEDVAKTPLRDLNIDKKDIPEVLLRAAENPYATAGLGKCGTLVREIAELDAILGADYDIAEGEEKRGISAGRIGQSVVGSIIPFRGVLREVTGAASSQRALEAAYTAGMVRRAYLKGWGQGRGCAYPARPKKSAQAKAAGGKK